jgi:hypothetical protein
MNMEDSTKKTLMAVGVGVGATGVIATAMYFLGGREAPKMPSLGDVTGFTKREIGFGVLSAENTNIPKALHEEFQRAYGDSYLTNKHIEIAVARPDGDTFCVDVFRDGDLRFSDTWKNTAFGWRR